MHGGLLALWQAVEKLTASDGSLNAGFGSSVDLENGRALIRAPRVGGGLLGTAAVYVFEVPRHRSLRR